MNAKRNYIVVLFLFFGVLQASAFYDPNIQRWPNRDPADDWGSIVNHVQNVLESEIDRNRYRFVGNDPIQYTDLFGLKWRASGKADLNRNTIVCDGKTGRPRIQLCPDAKKGCAPGVKCAEEHEQSHIDDVLKENPNICKDKRDGTEIWTFSTKQRNASERKAYDREIDCVRRNSADFDKQCDKSSADYIKDLQKDRKRYE
jgi:hypothetical protein